MNWNTNKTKVRNYRWNVHVHNHENEQQWQNYQPPQLTLFDGTNCCEDLVLMLNLTASDSNNISSYECKEDPRSY